MKPHSRARSVQAALNAVAPRTIRASATESRETAPRIRATAATIARGSRCARPFGAAGRPPSVREPRRVDGLVRDAEQVLAQDIAHDRDLRREHLGGRAATEAAQRGVEE